VTENRNELIAATMAKQAVGMAEPDAAILLVADLVEEKRRRIVVGADKAWGVTQNQRQSAQRNRRAHDLARGIPNQPE